MSVLGVLSLYRVVYVFGKAICEPIPDVTPTYLTPGVLATLRQVDFVANQVLNESGKCCYFCVRFLYILANLYQCNLRR